MQIKRKVKRSHCAQDSPNDTPQSLTPLPKLQLAADEALVTKGNRTAQITRTCHVCQGRGEIVSTKKRRGMDKTGVVTIPRRPPDFKLRGPLRPSSMTSPQPQAGEALCCLSGDWRIFQPVGGHRYSTDDVVTAWIAGEEMRRGWGRELLRGVESDKADGECAGLLLIRGGGEKQADGRREEVVRGAQEQGEGLRGLDLGCGLGSVLMMVCWQLPRLHAVGIEAQASSVERARRSLLVNGCADRACVRHGDFRNFFPLSSSGSAAAKIRTSLPAPPPPLSPLVSSSSSLSSPEPRAFEARTFHLITGTPPYFDGHGAPAPSHPADPPISVTSLSSCTSSTSSLALQSSPSTTSTVLKTKSGKARLRPSLLPAAEDQRPCNFELRGGVEAYIQTAAVALSGRGIFVMCASDLPGVEARVLRAAAAEDLTVLRKVEVEPKEGQPNLFAVYTMCHANVSPMAIEKKRRGQDGKDGSVERGESMTHRLKGRELDEENGNGAMLSTGHECGFDMVASEPGMEGQRVKILGGVETGSVGLEGDARKHVSRQREHATRPSIKIRERLPVRKAMPSTLQSNPKASINRRTYAYRRVLHDMCMPDNEI